MMILKRPINLYYVLQKPFPFSAFNDFLCQTNQMCIWSNGWGFFGLLISRFRKSFTDIFYGRSGQIIISVYYKTMKTS